MDFYRYNWNWSPNARISSLNERADATADILVQVAQRFDFLENAMERLQATITVQQQMLAEAGQLDPAKVGTRVEAELKRMHTPQPPPPPDLSGITGTTSSVRCIRCHRDVPANTTNMTADGPMCDRSCAP